MAEIPVAVDLRANVDAFQTVYGKPRNAVLADLGFIPRDFSQESVEAWLNGSVETRRNGR